MKRYIFITFLAVSVTALYGLSEALEAELQHLSLASSVMEQLIIVQNVVDAQPSDAGEFYAIALERLNREYPSMRGNQALEAADTYARLLTGLLGDEKYQPAAQNIWRSVDAFSNPLVKESGLIALGKIRAMEFLPQVIQMLTDLNTHPRSDQVAKEVGERIAYGAIISLENYRNPAGYMPVFFASVGWYHERVKSRAQAALPQIIDDPSEPLSRIIQSSSYSYSEKYGALQTIERSWVSNDKKSAVAVRALTESWRSSPSDLRRRRELVEIRKLALGMISRYGTEDETVYPLLERTYREGSEDEKFPAIIALAALATDNSVQLLAAFLRSITVRLEDNTLTRTDERMVRTIIPALGATHKASAIPVLRSLQTTSWTGTVKRLAAEALKEIG